MKSVRTTLHCNKVSRKSVIVSRNKTLARTRVTHTQVNETGPGEVITAGLSSKHIPVWIEFLISK
jgi:hypothetical protein